MATKKSTGKSLTMRLLLPVVVGIALAAWLVSNWLLATTLVAVGQVSKGPMEVRVEEDGKTRIREKYVVSAPLMGKLLRIELNPGDIVVAKQTNLATILPPSPTLLDQRQTVQGKARENAAKLAVDRAKSREIQASQAAELAEKVFNRLRALGSTVARQDLESAESELKSHAAALTAARIESQIAEFELQQAQAALLTLSSDGSDRPSDRVDNFDIYSPVNGRVLKVLQESSAIVQPGTPLIEIGDPADIEIEVDVLSSQAVRIEPGNPVLIEHWGGDTPLHGIVRRVEPAGFTKVSALGVEEQRVYVIVDLLEPALQRPSLGDAYRIEASIVIWRADNVLQVPTSALFRTQTRWTVFAIENGILRLREIEIGQRNRQSAEVLSGLNENERVVLHPTDQLRAGLRVRPQE